VHVCVWEKKHLPETGVIENSTEAD